MKTHPLQYALILALAGTLALAGCRKKDADATAATPPVPVEPSRAPAPSAATVRITGIDLGTSVGPDNRIANPVTTFAGRDTIHASIPTDGSTNSSKLTVRWTFQDGQVVHEESNTLTTYGPAVQHFTISKPDGFPPGKYQLAVLLDGTTVQTREFEVR